MLLAHRLGYFTASSGLSVVTSGSQFFFKYNIYFREFDSQLAHHYRRLQVETFTWQSYHTLDDIYKWLSDMALKYPKIVELVSIGKSFNGKNIYAIAINRPGANESVLVEGGIHGNEWISTEFVTYLINELVNANFLMGAVMSYNWYLVPVLNPDGYEYSQKVVSAEEK